MKGIAGVGLALALGAAPFAQAPEVPSGAALQFEVASVKPNSSASPRSSSSMPPSGLFRAVNMSVRQLMTDAFRVRSFQITGGPDWVDSERFDIQARTADGAPSNQMPAMLQSLLRDRFGLAVHSEARDQPVYLLVPERADRRLGPSLKPSICAGSACGMNSSISNGAGTLTGTGRTMADLAGWASNSVDRIVLDRTGMMGAYDFELSFTRDPGVSGLQQDAPSIFTALREQLGLRLESGRGPVTFIVIDRLTRPTPD